MSEHVEPQNHARPRPEDALSSPADAATEEKLRLQGIVASAMDAIIAVDSNQKIILFNPAAEVMFGAKQSDVLGQSISQFIPERHRAHHDEHIRRFRQTGVTARRMGALGSISGLRADGEEFPIEASISQAVVNDETLSTVILRDITERRANEEARAILAREVDHRAKNALAIVQSMVSLTTASTQEAYTKALKGRINTLARAHSLLAQSRWRGAELQQVVSEETEAYAEPRQVRAIGPQVTLASSAVQPIGLILHELSTNAIKHGALSRPDGLVSIAWERLEGGRLALSWCESGGPTVAEPTDSGFGTTLLRTLAVKQLRGELKVNWQPEGLELHLTLPDGIALTPLADPPASRQSLSHGSQGPSDARRRILVVEDEVLLGLELGKALADAGWQVLGPATSLEESLELLRNEAIDAATLDVNLRGEKVYPLADMLVDRQIPFIFFTGYEEFDSHGRYGGVPVVRKPGSFHSVEQALRTVAPLPDSARA